MEKGYVIQSTQLRDFSRYCDKSVNFVGVADAIPEAQI